MVEIKAYYGKWTPATRDDAVRFASWLFHRFTAPMSTERKLEVINSKHIRGTEVTPLEVEAWP